MQNEDCGILKQPQRHKEGRQSEEAREPLLNAAHVSPRLSLMKLISRPARQPTPMRPMKPKRMKPIPM
jgi:hypothetical protein